jgi:hypothetical protein
MGPLTLGLWRRPDDADAGWPARLGVEALDLAEQLVAAGLPQRQALGVLDEAVRLGERAEEVEVAGLRQVRHGEHRLCGRVHAQVRPADGVRLLLPEAIRPRARDQSPG